MKDFIMPNKRQIPVVFAEDRFKVGRLIPDPKHLNKQPPVYWKVEDAHFMSLFDVADIKPVEGLFKRIRQLKQQYKNYHTMQKYFHLNLTNKLYNLEVEKNKLLHVFFDCLVEHANGHTDSIMQIGNLKIKPKKVSCRDDIQTLNGVALDNKNITGEGFTDWNYVAIGIGTEEPFVWSDSLQTEISEQDFGHGFFTSSGTAILYAAMFGEGEATNTYTEALVRDLQGPTGAKVLCKQIFTDDPITHTNGNSGFAVAGILEYTPIVDGTVFQ